MKGSEGRRQTVIRAPFFLLLLFLCYSPLDAESYLITELDHAEELHSSAISGIVQDAYGFLWFGTQGGLSRYDGYSYKTWNKEPFDRESLPHDLVQTIYSDSGYEIWIGTYYGAAKMDLKSGELLRFVPDTETPGSLYGAVVTSFARDQKGRLWIGTLKGLNLLDEDAGSFTHFLKGESVRTIFPDREGFLWVGTYNGIYRMDLLDDGFHHIPARPGEEGALQSPYVMTIQEGEGGALWIGTWGDGGLARMHSEDETVETFQLPAEESYVIEAAEGGEIWVGSWGGGLFRFHPEDGVREEYGEKDLGNGIVYSLYTDPAGVLWVGTNGGGIRKMISVEMDLPFWGHEEDDPESLPPGKITSIFEDPRGELWVGVYGNGLNRYLPDEAAWVTYRHDPKDASSISNNIVNAIYEARDGTFWLCTNQGLNRMDRKEGTFSLFHPDLDGIGEPGDDIVYDILEDEGGYWIATYRGGVVRWEPSAGDPIAGEPAAAEGKGSFRFFRHQEHDPASISDDMVFKLLLDEEGTLWAGTNRGLNRFNREEESFTRFIHRPDEPGSISADTVRTMFIDSLGRFWIGTAGGGINLLNRSNETFQYWGKKDGFPDNTIVSILEDQKNRLWLASPGGLGLFSPEKSFFKILDRTDGIRGKEFNTGSYKNDSGDLYFGSIEGLVKVSPSEFQDNHHIPPVELTSFTILGKEYQGESALTELEDVTLSHRQNFISFEFAALDYTDPRKNEYMYQLQGFDSEWIYAGNRRYVSYTNLPGGEYRFQVRGTNNDGVWNMSGRSLKITVIPSFWKRPVAFLLYILALGFAIFLVVYTIIRRQKQKLLLEERRLERDRIQLLEREMLEREQVEHQLRIAKEAAEEAVAAKSSFIAGMSHEFRTPLNAIIGYASFIKERSDSDEIRRFGESIYKNGEQLTDFVTDILDLSRSEAGKLVINPQPVNPSLLLGEAVAVIEPLAERKRVVVLSEVTEQVPEVVVVDAAKVRQILFNLTGNAVKFTDSGKIEVSVDREGGELIWKVTDTGIGIPEKERERIFKPFEQHIGQGSSYGGTGLGLSISRNLVRALGGSLEVTDNPTGGARFILRHPFGSPADSPSELPTALSLEAGSSVDSVKAPQEPKAPGARNLPPSPGDLLSPERLRAVLGDSLSDEIISLSGHWFLDRWSDIGRKIESCGKAEEWTDLEEIGGAICSSAEKAQIGELKKLSGVLVRGLKGDFQ